MRSPVGDENRKAGNLDFLLFHLRNEIPGRGREQNTPETILTLHANLRNEIPGRGREQDGIVHFFLVSLFKK